MRAEVGELARADRTRHELGTCRLRLDEGKSLRRVREVHAEHDAHPFHHRFAAGSAIRIAHVDGGQR
jgi:hypothetical protein